MTRPAADHRNRSTPTPRAKPARVHVMALLVHSCCLALVASVASDAYGQAGMTGPVNQARQPPSGDTKLGRLFYSPERRQSLEQQRLSNRPTEKQVESRQLSLDGLVLRSSGKRTVWVNGRPLTEHDSGVLDVKPRPGQPGRARITIPNEGGHELAVGSQVNRETGETSSPLKSGRVQVIARP